MEGNLKGFTMGRGGVRVCVCVCVYKCVYECMHTRDYLMSENLSHPDQHRHFTHSGHVLVW